MIYTARQLEDLHRSNGHVTLPRGARLSPLATDWVRARRVAIAYSDGESPKPQPAAAGVNGGSAPPTASTGAYLWWCDGPCGSGKAALAAIGKESSLAGLKTPSDGKQVVPAVKELAAGLRSGHAAGGIFLVQASAVPLVYLNRCPTIRAMVGTTLAGVEQGVRQVAANVLVVEYPQQSLQQLKNLIGRFVRGRRDLDPEVERQLKELASCA